MSQYRNGYAYLVNGSNIITSSGIADWSDIITSGKSVFSIEGNAGFYYINSVTGPHFSPPYYPGNASGHYKLYLSSAYDATLGGATGYNYYAITTSFTPRIGLPLVSKGDINVANIVSSAFYKIDRVFSQIEQSGIISLGYLVDNLEEKVYSDLDLIIADINEISGHIGSLVNIENKLNLTGDYFNNYLLTGFSSVNTKISTNASAISQASNSISALSNSFSVVNERLNEIDTQLDAIDLDSVVSYVDSKVGSGVSGSDSRLSQQLEYYRIILSNSIDSTGNYLYSQITGSQSSISVAQNLASQASADATNSKNYSIILSGYLDNRFTPLFQYTGNSHQQNSDSSTTYLSFYLNSAGGSNKAGISTLNSDLSAINYTGGLNDFWAKQNYSSKIFLSNYVENKTLGTNPYATLEIETVSNETDLLFKTANTTSTKSVYLADKTWVMNWIQENVISSIADQSNIYTSLAQISGNLNTLANNDVSLSSRVSILEGSSSVNVASQIADLQGQITDNDRDIYELNKRIAVTGLSTYRFALSPAGLTDYAVNFPETLDKVPALNIALSAGAGDPYIGYYIKSKDKYGFEITFANPLPNTNYALEVFAYV